MLTNPPLIEAYHNYIVSLHVCIYYIILYYTSFEINNTANILEQQITNNNYNFEQHTSYNKK